MPITSSQNFRKERKVSDKTSEWMFNGVEIYIVRKLDDDWLFYYQCKKQN